MATEHSWRLASAHPVGGLTEIGFAPDTALLLVVSFQGRGVIDCETGERIARDRSDAYAEWFDKRRMAALGVGPLAGRWISVFGLAGGQFPDSTADGWKATADGDDVTLSDRGAGQILSAGVMDLRAFGFSPDGRFFVLATPADVDIYRRA
jgi:hypothetical protein